MKTAANKAVAASVLTGLALAIAPATANNDGAQNQCVVYTSTASNGSFPLVSNGMKTVIYTDAEAVSSVHRAAQSFAGDLRNIVHGANVEVMNATDLSQLSSSASSATGENWVFYGTLDKGNLINSVINETSVDVTAIRGQWESYTIQQGQLGGKAVGVMAGADRRGATYAAYTVSEEAGVSPWYWWADVPITSHSELYLKPCSHDSPAVKYRGIFLNDEQPGLTSWANKKFHAGQGVDPLGQSFLPAMYEKMFELILRLKGNMLWPAMWADMFAVAGLEALPNQGKTGVNAAGPNQVLADAMGVIYSTSHQEPMARNTPEWSNYGTGEWNYTQNRDVLDQFWRYGAERAKGLETLFTVSMRGNGDLPLPGANIKNLQEIVTDQRNILSETHGTPAEQIPQIWALYKEVQGYYDTDGMEVPEDITLLWSDDNWGNIRRVGLANETDRSGSAGQYYHLDYVGDPRSYKWISTINYAKMWEQLNVAQNGDTSRLLIFNVGDLKPIEIATTLGLSLGYEGTASLAPTNSSGLGVTAWVERWAGRTFPTLDSEKVAYVVEGYNALNAKIKPELVNSTTWSLTQFDEAERVQGQWQMIVDTVNDLQSHVGDDLYPAFYQLVAYPALAAANLNELYIAVGRANLYASQARTSANVWADKAQMHFSKDEELTHAYHALCDYKWDGMMSQTHINYQYWQQPMRDTLPGTSTVQRDYWPRMQDGRGPMRITIPTLKGAWPGDNVNNCALGYNCPGPTLSGLSRYDTGSYWVDVGSGAWEDFEWTATSNVTWLSMSTSQGKITAEGKDDCRVYVSVNWDQVDASAPNTSYASIMFATKPNDRPQTVVNVTVVADTRMVDTSSAASGSFIGGAAYTSMHAVNATRRNNVSDAYWADLPKYGLTGNAITDLPPTHAFYEAGQGPSLEFDFYSHGTTAPLNVTAFFGPFENYHRGRPFQYALTMDGGDPVIVQPIPIAKNAGSEPSDWTSVVAASLRKSKTTFNETGAASAGWHTLKVWNMVPGMVLEQIVVGEYPLTSLPPPQSYRMA